MRENKIAFGLIILVIIIVAIAIGLYAYALGNKPQLLDVTINSETQSFVVKGKKLSSVDIWIVPTGTSITEKDHQKLTTMNLTNKGEADQIWTAHVPTQQFLATSIYIKGYDENNKEVATKTLPYTGATEIYNAFSAFWAPTKATSTKATTTLPTGVKFVPAR